MMCSFRMAAVPGQASGLGGRRSRRGGRLAKGPHAFQVVEAADFGPEQVDDDIARIDQHPIGRGQPLNPYRTPGFGLDLFGQRSVEHTTELQSLMRISYAVFS